MPEPPQVWTIFDSRLGRNHQKPSVYRKLIYMQLLSRTKDHFAWCHDTAWILLGDVSWLNCAANGALFSLPTRLRVSSLTTVSIVTPGCCCSWWWLSKQLSAERCDVISSPVRCIRFILLRWFWNQTFTYTIKAGGYSFRHYTALEPAGMECNVVGFPRR